MLIPKVFIDKGTLSKSGEANIYLIAHVDSKTVKFWNNPPVRKHQSPVF
ncbi:MAG: hypothetical protein RBS73_08420 [Prolixibacteraceae bacterium]|jgi:hypothetical protein|nr:hypothetical protein [Prolixibacteraceae bacterium]